jgi:enamine deaminase RidA (YjgF/YER057c/UK114 family)
MQRTAIGAEHAVGMTSQEGAHGPELFRGLPYDYGSVVREGALLFTAGACPLDSAGKVVSPGDPMAQAVAALANLEAVLESHGAGPQHLVRTTIYVVGSHADLVSVWGVIAAGLAPHRPPSTLLGVAMLGYADQLVEIDGIAALPA